MADIKKLKPLVITARIAQSAGSEYQWNGLENKKMLIDNIVTQAVNVTNNDELNKLISGIPTPLARQAMFKYAIGYGRVGNEELTGLMSFYKTLQNEWKGLIACIALDNQPLTVEKIPLSYSDGEDVYVTRNMYESKGALGNMLFEDKLLWCDQQEIRSDEGARNAKPYIYVIRYNGVVVGGTSPHSLLFTAPVYHINSPKGFYSQLTKAFTDPLNAELSAEEVEKLYVYVNHVHLSINNFKNSFERQRHEIQHVNNFLNVWLTEIENYARNKRYEIKKDAIVPNFNKFGGPFDQVFNFQTTLYGYNGRISSNIANLNLRTGEGDKVIEDEATQVELAELLLNPDTCTVAEIVLDDDNKKVEDLGVHMLKATTDQVGKFKYFTLPLSEKGMAIFQNEMAELLNGGGNNSNLSAFFDDKNKTLKVTLKINVDDNLTSFTKNYKEPVRIEDKKIICWPDFVSANWNKYYLYSELPHNSPDLKAYPLRADTGLDFQFLRANDGRFHFRKIAENGRIAEGEDAEILIEYDINKINSTEFKYEIYESTLPFKGIEFQFKSKPAGYLVFKYFAGNNQNALEDYRNEKINLNSVRVGFDFGSNNICISYAEDGNVPKIITFKNRRRFLLGSESTDSKAPALQNKIFFLQGEETQSNQIKSMIMIHDEKRVKDAQRRDAVTVELSKPVKGGFPVFEKNIPVEESEETTHRVTINGQQCSAKYNMKWSSYDKENAFKRSLLSTLWLKTYAELLDKEKYPESLVWAYPSSMNTQIIDKYSMLWDEIGQLNPLGDRDNARVAKKDDDVGELRAQTEAESVCRYALSVSGLGLADRSLLIGFDVGGSTTDILCVAVKDSAKNKSVETLIKQSSIKFAAGKLADATRKSKKFKQALTSFCWKKNFLIHGVTIQPYRLNDSTSPYYFNLVIDRLKTRDELDEFYRNIAVDCPELFIINSYMTGLIMFYVGQLANKIKKDSKGDTSYPNDFFDEVRIGIFGKGGRMFDWLKAISKGAASNYYFECFELGYGEKFSADNFNIVHTDPEFVKAEVSFGLSNRKKINIDNKIIHELVGEEGYRYNNQPIESLADVKKEYLRDFGKVLSYPKEFKRFSEFVDKFYGFAKERFGFNFPNIQKEINNMPIVPYVNRIPEYILATNSNDGSFDFEAPIIILEGMCFLDEVLLKKVFN